MPSKVSQMAHCTTQQALLGRRRTAGVVASSTSPGGTKVEQIYAVRYRLQASLHAVH